MTIQNLRSERAGESGVATTLVAVLLSVVFMVFLALSVDLGRVVLERRELQNGADAGALSLAQSCAKGRCSPDADGVLDLVNSNADDGLHAMRVCGSDEGLDPCTSAGSISDLKQCPPNTLASGVSYVEVSTTTLRPGEQTFLQNIFGSVAGGVADSTPEACARAAYGPPITGTTIPFTLSQCEWELATSNAEGVPGSVFGVETALPIQYKNSAIPCAMAPSGGDFPGAFGHLNQSGCLSEISADNMVSASTGNGKWNQCRHELLPLPKVVYLPVYDDYMAGRYHISGFAAFEVTGWDYVGPKTGSWSPQAQAVCNTNSRNGHCIFGRWVEDLAPPGFIPGPGGADLGLSIVQMAG